MKFKEILIFILLATVVVLGLLSLVFLVSAAMFGSFLLPLVCLGSMFLFFYTVAVLNKDHRRN